MMASVVHEGSLRSLRSVEMEMLCVFLQFEHFTGDVDHDDKLHVNTHKFLEITGLPCWF